MKTYALSRIKVGDSFYDLLPDHHYSIRGNQNRGIPLYLRPSRQFQENVPVDKSFVEVHDATVSGTITGFDTFLWATDFYTGDLIRGEKFKEDLAPKVVTGLDGKKKVVRYCDGSIEVVVSNGNRGKETIELYRSPLSTEPDCIIDSDEDTKVETIPSKEIVDTYYDKKGRVIKRFLSKRNESSGEWVTIDCQYTFYKKPSKDFEKFEDLAKTHYNYNEGCYPVEFLWKCPNTGLELQSLWVNTMTRLNHSGETESNSFTIVESKKYDDKGRLIKDHHMTRKFMEGDFETSFKSTTKYNEDLTATSFVEYDHTLQVTTFLTADHPDNKSGKLITVRQEENGGQTLSREIKDGLLIREERLFGDVITYAYDDQGRILSRLNNTTGIQSIYSYDEEGLVSLTVGGDLRFHRQKTRLGTELTFSKNDKYKK